MHPAYKPVRELYFYKLISFSDLTSPVIVVERGNLKLLIVNLQDNTGLCHYVISVRYKFEGTTRCNIAGTTRLIQTSETKTTSPYLVN